MWVYVAQRNQSLGRSGFAAGWGERSWAVLQTGRNRPPENSGLIPLSLPRTVRQLAAYYRASLDQLTQRDVEDSLFHVRDELGKEHRG